MHSQPLTNTHKKKTFLWIDYLHQAFLSLKQTMCSSLVLALSNFTKPSVIEYEASSTCIGAVLMQEGISLSLINQQLSGKNMG